MLAENEYTTEFALGSCQYDGIYSVYNYAKQHFNLSLNEERTIKIIEEMCNSYTDNEEDYYREILKHGDTKDDPLIFDKIKEFILVSYALKNLMLNLKLKICLDMMKGSAWDLWSALHLIPLDEEINKYISKIDLDLSTETKKYGLKIWWLAKNLNLSDNEVRNIFGNFST